MRKSTHKQFVQNCLEVMFATVKHSSQDEREVRTPSPLPSPHSLSSSQGCAIGAGFAATNHLDLVVEKLETITKQDMVKKSKGFFGFSKVMNWLIN